MKVTVRTTLGGELAFQELDVDGLSVALGSWQLIASEPDNRLELRPLDLREPTLSVVPLVRPVEAELEPGEAP